MKPFDNKYVLDIIIKYNALIKHNKVGDYEIKSIDGLKGIVGGYLYEKEENINLDILELHGPDHIWMRLTPLEIQASFFPIKRAKGKVGVVGLGLGYVVEEMAKKEEVEEVIVYEISKEVIDLYYSNFSENKKIKILNVDAYESDSMDFDFFYADIYEYKITSNIVDDYKKFKLLHNIKEYSFFGMEHFLLSCSYDEIVWVYIPENWMEMSKCAYETLQQSGKLPYYKQLDKEIVSDVLAKFKIVLDEIE